MDNSKGGGVGFLGLLALLFIGLKLGGVIDWSWWWVTAPLWGGPALLLAIVATLFVGYVGVKAIVGFAGLFRRKPINPSGR